MASVGVGKSTKTSGGQQLPKNKTGAEIRALSSDWRRELHLPKDLGQKLADAVANGMGSWNFIIAQSVIVGAWIVLNVIGFTYHWDVYPFILLNLLFSTQAAYAAPVIMMSQNRQAQKDHIRDDHEAEEVDLLYQINRQQLEILTLLRANLCPEDAEKLAKQLSAPIVSPANKANGVANDAAGNKASAQTSRVNTTPTRRKR